MMTGNDRWEGTLTKSDYRKLNLVCQVECGQKSWPKGPGKFGKIPAASLLLDTQ